MALLYLSKCLWFVFEPYENKWLEKNGVKVIREKIEDIELLRAIEIGLKIKSPVFSGDSFSVDVLKDYKKAKKAMKIDKYFKLYKS